MIGIVDLTVTIPTAGTPALPEASQGTMKSVFCVIALCVLVCLILLSPSAATGIVLSRNGHTDYTIVCAENPIPAETCAVQELAGYLGKMTGAAFRTTTEKQAGNGASIYVGPSGASRRALTDINPSMLGQEEFIIRTVGRDLCLVGGRPRGTLYAVYFFLDNVLGVRWWAPGATFVPERHTLRAPALDIRQKPVLDMRGTFPRTGTS